MKFVVPVYILIWLFGIYASGGYKKPVNLYKVIRGILWGLISILLIYSLVDEQFRFSRALILLGSFWAILMLPFYRIVLHSLHIQGFRLETGKLRVKKLLEKTRIQSELAGFIALDNTDKGENYMGELKQLNEIIRINRLDEVIFCAENISSAQIIGAMLDMSQLDVNFKIAPPESVSIIGSNSIHTAGDLYVVNMNAISKKRNRIKKRIFDIEVSLILILISPFLIFFFQNKKTWVGYISVKDSFEDFPELKKGILNPGDIFSEIEIDPQKQYQLNMLYAKDYRLQTDAEILLKAWRKLDR